MKKTTGIALALAFVASTSLAFAQELAVKPEGVGGGMRQQVRAEFQQKKTQVVDKVKTEMAEWKTERQQALQNLKQEKDKLESEFKQKFAADRCAKIQARMQERSANVEGAKTKHMSVYNNLLARIDKFITRFDALDKANPGKLNQENLAKLKTDRATLATMITTFQSNFADYFAKIKATKTTTCTTTEGDFRGALADTKVYLDAVHTSAAGIRTFVRETILPDLLAVKKDIAQAGIKTVDATETPVPTPTPVPTTTENNQ